ncbi:MAG: glycerol-3-phosphate dehydrogenase [Clostridia bacterium]
MNIFCIGCGRWGSFLAWYLSFVCAHSVTVYGRCGSSRFEALKNRAPNAPIILPHSVLFTNDLEDIKGAEIVVIAIDAQGFRALARDIGKLDLKNKYFVLCMKGIEVDTGKRLSEIAAEYLDISNKIAVWLGPGHVEEMMKFSSNCMVIDSLDSDAKYYLVKAFSSEIIRFYYGKDLIGNEIGASSKNVIGIAAGMLDGLGLSNLKGALMSRATYEISMLIEALGGNRLTAYGLCHLGDYEATVFSKYSHNRKYGESLVENTEYSLLAEGYYTAEALMTISRRINIALPICTAVYNVIYNHTKPRDELSGLFLRSLREEY